MSLLDVHDLRIGFDATAVVEDLSFSVEKGETLAIVGESGCGKSITALALMRLTDPAASVSGEVHLDGRELYALDERRMRAVRGRDIGIVFQDPMSALNPVLTIGEQITEAIRAHERLGRAQARNRALKLLDLVHIPDAARRLEDYPHRFSGGMRQRVAIAIAIAASPKLLIADEPTTALDVTIQAQILNLLRDLQQELDMALILITHDLGVVAETADRVLVMYAGRKVEEQPVAGLFADPLHPYTRRLIGSKPQLTEGSPGRARVRLQEISGLVPMPGTIPAGCAFAPRCDVADELCARERPVLRQHGGAKVACHRPGERPGTVQPRNRDGGAVHAGFPREAAVPALLGSAR